MILTHPQLSVGFPSYENQVGVTYYAISLECPAGSWTLSKRFSQFVDLHESMKRRHKQLPMRPKKTLFKLKKAADIERRKSQLEEYCRRLLERSDLLQDETLQAFFEVEEHYPELVVRTRPRLGTIEKPHFALPLTHLLSDDETTLLITAESASTESSSKPKSATPESFLKLFDLAHVLPCDKQFESTLCWTLKCPHTIASVRYCPTLRVICWGTDGGLLFIEKLMATNEILDSTAGLHVHDGRITAICVEETQEYVITIGSDKKIAGTSMSGKGLFCAKLGEHALTDMLLERESGRILVSNVRSQIYICDVQCVKLNVLQVLTSIENCDVHVLAECLTPHLYSTYAEDGTLRWCLLDGSSDSKTIGTKKLQGDSTAMAYYEPKGILVLGNSLGQLKFLDIETGTLKLTLQCHQAAITALHLDPVTGVTITASKDASVAVYKWPLD
jgi:hypothetical protein